MFVNKNLSQVIAKTLLRNSRGKTSSYTSFCCFISVRRGNADSRGILESQDVRVGPGVGPPLRPSGPIPPQKRNRDPRPQEFRFCWPRPGIPPWTWPKDLTCGVLPVLASFSGKGLYNS